MARTLLNIQDMKRTGLSASFVNADNANGMYFVNDPGRTFLHIKNTGGTVCNVTVQYAKTGPDGLTVTNRQVAVPITSGDVEIGPFTSDYNQADGTTYVDFSTGGANVQVRAVRIP